LFLFGSLLDLFTMFAFVVAPANLFRDRATFDNDLVGLFFADG
jgi:hypothetical protein